MLVSVLFSQIIIMTLLMAGGFLMVKRGLLSEQGSKDLGLVLVNVVIPSVVLKSYMIDFSWDKLKDLGMSVGLALLTLGLAMLLSWIVFGLRQPIQNFAAAFGNAGFMGIPLAQALYGEEAVFYVAAYVAFLNLFQQTYGVYVMTGDKGKIQFSRVVKNPVFLSIVIGAILFLLPVSYPVILTKTFGYIADLNTPLAMIILGSYMVGISPRDILLSKEIYSCMVMRLLVIPFATMGLYYVLPLRNEMLLLSLLVSSATSVGGVIAVLSRQYEADYQMSVKTVCLSTILSLVTLPAFFWVAQQILSLQG